MQKIQIITILFSLLICIAAEWDENCENPPELEQYNGYCCHEDEFIGSDDPENLEIIKNCAKKFGLTFNGRNDVILTSETLEANFCYSECVFKANNYTNNGIINLDLMKIDAGIHNNETKNIKELETIFVKAVDLCGKIVDEKLTDLKKLPNGEEYFKTISCSPVPLIFNECLAKEYYRNCPEKYWFTDSQDCKDARSFVLKCLV